MRLTTPMQPGWQNGTVPRKTGASEFLRGAKSPVRAAFFIIRHPSLWPYCIAPVLINITIIVLVWLWLHGLFSGLLLRHFPPGDWWQDVVHYAMKVVFFILQLLASLVAFVTIGNIAAVPFNDLLSERTDEIASGWKDDRPFNFRRFAGEVLTLLIQEMKRIAIYVPIMTMLIIASFSAFLAPIALAGKVLVSAWFFAAEYYSYPLERRGVLLLGDKLSFVRFNTGESIGFGLVMTAIGLIPVVNFLFLPLGVVAGTLLFKDLSSSDLHLPSSPPSS